jgi:hypothetical protein
MKERVDAVKPTYRPRKWGRASSRPRHFDHDAKKHEALAQWCEKVERQNFVLAERIRKIAKYGSGEIPEPRPPPQSMQSLNYPARRAEYRHISRENKILAKRLHSVIPFYHRDQWQASARNQDYMAKHMQRDNTIGHLSPNKGSYRLDSTDLEKKPDWDSSTKTSEDVGSRLRNKAFFGFGTSPRGYDELVTSALDSFGTSLSQSMNSPRSSLRRMAESHGRREKPSNSQTLKKKKVRKHRNGRKKTRKIGRAHV